MSKVRGAMEKDFILRSEGNAWRAVATSDSGKAFAEADPRFHRSEAHLTPTGALTMFREISGRGLSVSLPDGLPYISRGSLIVRLLLALLVLIPGSIFLYRLLG